MERLLNILMSNDRAMSEESKKSNIKLGARAEMRQVMVYYLINSQRTFLSASFSFPGAIVFNCVCNLNSLGKLEERDNTLWPPQVCSSLARNLCDAALILEIFLWLLRFFIA